MILFCVIDLEFTVYEMKCGVDLFFVFWTVSGVASVGNFCCWIE